MAYERKITLHDDEIPARYNKRTGKYINCNVKTNNIPENMEDYKPDKGFIKTYVKVWEFLADNLTNTEMSVVTRMSIMLEYSTNSLNPLDDKTSVRNLSNTFNISTKTVKNIFEKLFDLGVYLSLRYNHKTRGRVEEWIFNPYIATKGRFVNSDLLQYFNSTIISDVIV